MSAATTRPAVSVRGQRGRGMGGHARGYEGETVEWYTPPGIFDALGLAFDLDPAAPAGGLPWIPAERFLSRADDGLTQPWAGRVWLNPPYGPHTAAWMRLTFVDADLRPGGWNAGAPSALVAYGQDAAEAIAGAGLGMTFSIDARPVVGQASLWESAPAPVVVDGEQEGGERDAG